MTLRIRRSLADKDQGFTLIELLVVIIIIGILAAIAIPVFLNQRKKAVDASMVSDLKNVALAMETYYGDKQAYPQAGSVRLGAGTAGGDFTANNQKITQSPSNEVYVAAYNTTTVLPGTFCLWVWSPGGTGGHFLYYDSDRGGVQPPLTYCT